MDQSAIKHAYDRDGYLSPLHVFGPDQAQAHRRILETAEAEHGALHYHAKMHTVLPSVWEMATHPKVLDAVEAILGPDILLYDATYIIKEPQTPSFVSWHQDLTFWGLSHDDQVSLWLALSPADAQSGCMRMIPGSHKQGMVEHATYDDPNNVLFQAQTVHGVNEDDAVLCPLKPGEASLHHGWTLHASMPNESDDRRIGVNAQYLAPHVRQTKHDLDSAILVRGEDRYGHYRKDIPATSSFLPEAMARWKEMNKLHIETQGTK